MALKGKLETEIEIKSAADKYYNIFRSTTHHFPKATPNIIQAVEVHEGDWETHGSIKFWNYTIEGNAEVFKEKVELDDANRAVTLVGIEGDVMNYFKSFKGTYQVTPKGNGSLVKLTLEYEKLTEEVPAPIKYHNMMVTMTKDIDAFLAKA
ncbi:MLP-like protein 28 [Juglans microcarpa x Juglans regia]|uniref:MLP-like protein 28 n=1 Tax=Juglans microcarpa x Juglans regia TaxID=2249226 RepID=UPI001B7EE960|nr:MLP-like protein 28 [Juglans microcarpa x Juglans regia]